MPEPSWTQVARLDGWQIKQLYLMFVGGGTLTNEDELTLDVSPESANVRVTYTDAGGETNEIVLEANDD